MMDIGLILDILTVAGKAVKSLPEVASLLEDATRLVNEPASLTAAGELDIRERLDAVDAALQAS